MTGIAKNERKKTASPGGTAWEAALMQVAIPVKRSTEIILSVMPRIGLSAMIGVALMTRSIGAHEAGANGKW